MLKNTQKILKKYLNAKKFLKKLKKLKNFKTPEKKKPRILSKKIQIFRKFRI